MNEEEKTNAILNAPVRQEISQSDLRDLFEGRSWAIDPRLSRETLFESAIIGAAHFVREQKLTPTFDGMGMADGVKGSAYRCSDFWESFETLCHCIMLAEANLINRIEDDGSYGLLDRGIQAADHDEIDSADDD